MAKKKETKEEKKTKQELVEFLLREIPNLFESVPRAALNRGAVERLVEKL